jgi:hypothetical protein
VATLPTLWSHLRVFEGPSRASWRCPAEPHDAGHIRKVAKRPPVSVAAGHGAMRLAQPQPGKRATGQNNHLVADGRRLDGSPSVVAVAFYCGISRRAFSAITDTEPWYIRQW